MHLATEIAEKLTVPHVVFPTPNFDQLMCLLGAVDACFIGEGGIMHLAAALNKPQLVLFGKTSQICWEPLSNKGIYLRDESDVKNIKPENVIIKLKQLLLFD